MLGVCRPCRNLGQAELAYRQGVRNIDRLLRGELISRRNRPLIERFLDDGDARVRAYAKDIIARDAAARAENARWREEEELAYERWAAESAAQIPDEAFTPAPLLDDIPF